jgi:hypothetical protein
MTQAIIVTVDREAFMKDVKGIFDPTAILGAADKVVELKYPDALKPPQLWDTIKKMQDLVGLICAAVEVTKQKFIANEPEGAKFDKELALTTAVQMLDDLIVFTGWAGAIIEKIDGPILNWIISSYVAGKPKDWLEEAKVLLAAK